MNGAQPDLFAGAYDVAGAARPRPAGPVSGNPEFVQVESGVWTLCVYGLIPKLGFEHLHFPHYFGGPPERTVWRVARHGELPGGTFLFDSHEHVVQVTAEVFGDADNLSRFMSIIEIPSDDQRRRA